MTDDLEHTDWNPGESIPPVKNRRVVVSVALSATDFALLGRAAELGSTSVSGYIRTAALEKLHRSSVETYHWTAGNRSHAILFMPAGPKSSTSRPLVDAFEVDTTTT